jgi:transcriptional/translational regulatory protein YebC/TACO1
MPKDRITTAIERGQGRSTSGAALEPVLVEAIGPGNVALVVDCLTDNKLRTLQDIKYILGKHSSQVTPTSYLFARKGLVRIVAGSGGHEFDSVLDSALEVEGTEDVEEIAGGEDGKPEILITTEPTRTGAVAAEVKERLPGLEVINYGIEWVPNEDTMVGELSEKHAQSLSELLEKLDDSDDVNDVYTNAKA